MEVILRTLQKVTGCTIQSDQIDLASILQVKES